MKQLVRGVGYDIYETADTVSLVIEQIAAEEASHPFKVNLSGLKYKVVPGTVNGVMAKLGGTRLDDATPPEGTLSASAYIYLKCQHNSTGNFPYAVTVEQGTSVPANEEEFLYIHIATVVVTSGKAVKTAQPVRTSLAAEYFKCGSSDPEYYTSQS